MWLSAVAVDPHTCHRHPDRVTGRHCSRCGRPACPECLRPASVGSHCLDCIRDARPARTERVRRRVALAGPVATRGLIAVNVAVFVLGLLQAAVDGGAGEIGAGLSGDRLPIHEELALFGPLVAEGEWWRVITSGFLHFGLIHLGMNMFGLYILGSVLERQIGSMRFLALYFAALVGGSLGALLLDPDALTAGASGAIYGVLGATFVVLRNRGVDPWSTGIGGWVVISIIWTFAVPGISIGGHVGGMLAGALVGMVMVPPGRRVDARVGTGVGAAASVALFVACLVVA